MSLLPAETYTYKTEESLELLIHSIKGNNICGKERKSFNVCRSTVVGKLVEPEICKEKAFKFINCFQKVRRDESTACKNTYNKAFECAQKNQGNWINIISACNTDLETYLNCN